jgi:hypothetical protein
MLTLESAFLMNASLIVEGLFARLPLENLGQLVAERASEAAVGFSPNQLSPHQGVL